MHELVLTVAHNLHIDPKYLNNTLNVCIRDAYKLANFIADQCYVGSLLMFYYQNLQYRRIGLSGAHRYSFK